MVQTFFTADTHFGHAGILGMCERPWGSADEHDEALIEAWNTTVQVGDVVWHLGDFAYRCPRQRVKQIFDRLNGEKHLVWGNHDFAERLGTRDLPWASQDHYAEVTTDDGTLLVLTHYGLRTWRKIRRGAVNLFGHSHGNLSGTTQCIDVGVDVMGYRPVTWLEIRARLAMQPVLWLRDDTDDTDELALPTQPGP